jgi:small-conductance mechanosensitive channel
MRIASLVSKPKSFLMIFIFILSMSLNAQTGSPDSSQVEWSDSARDQALSSFQRRVGTLDSLRTADSLRRLNLEAELASLRTTDNVKKEELLRELQGLTDRESLRIQRKKNEIDSLRKSVKGSVVRGLVKDTLFLIYSRLGSFSAVERATAISTRLETISKNWKFESDNLSILEAETTLDVVFDGIILVGISENDAIWMNSTKEELAIRLKKKFEEELNAYARQWNIVVILKEIGLAALVILVLVFAIKYINKLFKWTKKKIEDQEGKLIKGIHFNNFTLFDSKQQIKLLVQSNRFLNWFINLLLVYISLPLLFGIFPWTKNLATTLVDYVLGPLKRIALAIWNYMPNLFTIAVIVVVFYYVLRGIKFLKVEIEKGNLQIPGFYPEWAGSTFQIVRLITLSFMVVVIFPYLPGSESPVFRGVSVFLGFLFTFGSAGSLSNIIAGLVLTYMRLFSIGDRVKIGEIVGDVIEKSLLVTRIRTTKNEIVSIPNSTVMNSHTVNYSSDASVNGLILHTTVTIGYDVPWKKVHEALIEAANRTALLLKEPKAFVLQTSLDDFYVSYQLNASTDSPNKQASIYSDLHQNIQDSFNEAGIEILSPHYRAARDGNSTTIPADYLPKDYVAPSFRVDNTKA